MVLSRRADELGTKKTTTTTEAQPFSLDTVVLHSINVKSEMEEEGKTAARTEGSFAVILQPYCVWLASAGARRTGEIDARSLFAFSLFLFLSAGFIIRPLRRIQMIDFPPAIIRHGGSCYLSSLIALRHPSFICSVKRLIT